MMAERRLVPQSRQNHSLKDALASDRRVMLGSDQR
jgi:hypothetical protein